MTRRPTGSIDAAMAAIQTWMQETKRVVDSLRREVEELRKERIELNAQLRFATEQANREVIEAAKMKQQLDSVRSLPRIPQIELDDFDDATDVRPTAIPSLKHREDSTERDLHVA